MDVTKMVLTEEEQAAFALFLRGDTATLTREQFQCLVRRGLVLDAMDGRSGWFSGLPESGLCCLSARGKELRAYQRRQGRRDRRESRRYWITTGIAILALFLAALSLALQAYTWHMDQQLPISSSVYSKSGEAPGAPSEK